MGVYTLSYNTFSSLETLYARVYEFIFYSRAGMIFCKCLIGIFVMYIQLMNKKKKFSVRVYMKFKRMYMANDRVQYLFYSSIDIARGKKNTLMGFYER